MALRGFGANIRGLTAQKYDFQLVFNHVSETAVDLQLAREGIASWKTAAGFVAGKMNDPQGAASPGTFWRQVILGHANAGTKNQLEVFEDTLDGEDLRIGFQSQSVLKITIWDSAWNQLAQASTATYVSSGVLMMEVSTNNIKVWDNAGTKVIDYNHNLGLTMTEDWNFAARGEVNSAGKGGDLAAYHDRIIMWDDSGSEFNQIPTTRFGGIVGLTPISDDPNNNDFADGIPGDLYPDATTSQGTWGVFGAPTAHEAVNQVPYEGRAVAGEYIMPARDGAYLESRIATNTDVATLQLRDWGIAFDNTETYKIYYRVRLNANPAVGDTSTLTIEVKKADDTLLDTEMKVLGNGDNVWQSFETGYKTHTLTVAEVDGLKLVLTKTGVNNNSRAIQIGQVGLTLGSVAGGTRARYAAIAQYFGKAGPGGFISATAIGDRQLFIMQDPAKAGADRDVDLTNEPINAICVKVPGSVSNRLKYIAEEGGVIYSGPTITNIATPNSNEISSTVWLLTKTPKGDPWTFAKLQTIKWGLEAIAVDGAASILDVEVLYGGAGFDAPPPVAGARGGLAQVI